MGIVIRLPGRRHDRASARSIPNTAGSAVLPTARRASEKTRNFSAGMRPRAFQFEGALGELAPAKAQAAALPPTASMMASTELSTPREYSRNVNLSSVHASIVEKACELATIHAAMSPNQKALAKRLQTTLAALEVSSADICRTIDVLPSAWSQYLSETSGRQITLPVALKLCSAYGLTLDWIYRGDPSGLPQRLHAKIRDVA